MADIAATVAEKRPHASVRLGREGMMRVPATRFEVQNGSLMIYDHLSMVAVVAEGCWQSAMIETDEV